MARKLGKNIYPGSPHDFECFGPRSSKDDEFEGTKITDMGCFTQDSKDTNKYYHGAIVKHKTSGAWFVYFEWGRVGQSPTFQFMECNSQREAESEYVKQLKSKNSKRGEWVTIAGIKTLRAKRNKDCYLVRKLATGSTGLPDARRIQQNEGKQGKQITVNKKSPTVDQRTIALLNDLNMGTIAYTKGSMVDKSIPSQVAINEGRALLSAAKNRIAVIGHNVDNQIRDHELVEFTKQMYGRIPKYKPRNAKPKEWILSADNILTWEQDLDAFESALYSTVHETEYDPLAGMPIKMRWLPPKSPKGMFIGTWMPTATRHSHPYGNLAIRNIWEIERNNEFEQTQNKILQECHKIKERPQYQTKERADLPTNKYDLYWNSNTMLGFHGTRSINVSGILRTNFKLPSQLKGVVLTGALLGPGMYWASDYQKSVGYTSLRSSVWTKGSGSIGNRGAFMFVCDVCLGNMYVAQKPRGYTTPPIGYHSVYGKAGFTSLGGMSKLRNDEFIVYNTKQHKMNYLVEFTCGKM